MWSTTVIELRRIEADLEETKKKSTQAKHEIEAMLDELRSIVHRNENRPKAA